MSPDPKHPRHQTQTERDISGMEAKKEREAKAAITAEVDDEITGKHEGDDLLRMRDERREPLDRIRHLEGKHDKLDEKVDGIKSTVDTMSGKLDVLPQLISAVEKIAVGRSADEHTVFTSRVEVEKGKEISRIEVEKTTEIDKIHTRAEKRKRITRFLSFILGALGSGGLIGWLLGNR